MDKNNPFTREYCNLRHMKDPPEGYQITIQKFTDFFTVKVVDREKFKTVEEYTFINEETAKKKAFNLRRKYRKG